MLQQELENTESKKRINSNMTMTVFKLKAYTSFIQTFVCIKSQIRIKFVFNCE